MIITRKELEQEVQNLKRRLDMLESLSGYLTEGNIQAPCRNAYKDSRDGLDANCPCWRCSPYEKI